jgi:hypothetical protein
VCPPPRRQRAETDPVSERLCFLVSGIRDDGTKSKTPVILAYELLCENLKKYIAFNFVFIFVFIIAKWNITDNF